MQESQSIKKIQCFTRKSFHLLFILFSDDDNSHIEAVLTNDNLLDGTIITNTEQYYMEPSIRYSSELAKSGIHSIVYKLSDVQMKKSISNGTTTTMVPLDSAHHCASELLHRKMLRNDYKRKRKSKVDGSRRDDGVADIHYKNSISDFSSKTVNSKRTKRWLPDEVSIFFYFNFLLFALSLFRDFHSFVVCGKYRDI